jgi:PAS domain-containing protein
VHQEDRPLWRQALHELRRRPETSFSQRLRFVHPCGELRWFEVSLKRGPQGFYLVAGDITAHKRREIALQASQRSSMSLLDSMPGLIYRGRNNRDWTMEFVSAGCLQLTGYPAERLVDNHEFTYNSLILAEDADYVWREVQYALSRQEPFELNYQIRCADQSIKHVWEKGVGIYADTCEVLGIEGAIFERKPRRENAASTGFSLASRLLPVWSDVAPPIYPRGKRLDFNQGQLAISAPTIGPVFSVINEGIPWLAPRT